MSSFAHDRNYQDERKEDVHAFARLHLAWTLIFGSRFIDLSISSRDSASK